MSEIAEGHLPDCTYEPYADVKQRWVKEGRGTAEGLAGMSDRTDAGFVRCVEGCPQLERAIARGRELADNSTR